MRIGSSAGAAPVGASSLGAAGGGAGNHSGEANKGMWGMSWRQQAKKGVEGCDKPGEAVKQALIPGFPYHRALNP